MNSDFREAGEDVLELGFEAGKHEVLSIVEAGRGPVGGWRREAAQGVSRRRWRAASGDSSVT